MIKHKSKPALVVAKQTVRSLTLDESAAASGGYDSNASGYSMCVTHSITNPTLRPTSLCTPF